MAEGLKKAMGEPGEWLNTKSAGVLAVMGAAIMGFAGQVEALSGGRVTVQLVVFVLCFVCALLFAWQAFSDTAGAVPMRLGMAFFSLMVGFWTIYQTTRGSAASFDAARAGGEFKEHIAAEYSVVASGFPMLGIEPFGGGERLTRQAFRPVYQFDERHGGWLVLVYDQRGQKVWMRAVISDRGARW